VQGIFENNTRNMYHKASDLTVLCTFVDVSASGLILQRVSERVSTRSPSLGRMDGLSKGSLTVPGKLAHTCRLSDEFDPRHVG